MDVSKVRNLHLDTVKSRATLPVGAEIIVGHMGKGAKIQFDKEYNWTDVKFIIGDFI